MRARYVQINGELVPADEVARDPVADYHVMGDIEPYRSMATGEMIGSRSTHREHLRQHRLVEVGNETQHLKPFGPKPLPGLRQRLIEVASEKLRYK